MQKMSTNLAGNATGKAQIFMDEKEEKYKSHNKHSVSYFSKDFLLMNANSLKYTKEDKKVTDYN